MRSFISKVQLGKNGLTKNAILSIRSSLKNHKQTRVSILKSATREKKELGNIMEKIQETLKEDFKCSYRIIGYTIIITKLKALRNL